MENFEHEQMVLTLFDILSIYLFDILRRCCHHCNIFGKSGNNLVEQLLENAGGARSIVQIFVKLT